ncbi:MerR family transcriptional regulator [Saccharibacillus sp. CPCC 101409]|uniref:MerR family transcriptional regulator n=1 Tax=Saccharibacillus sp. CPCC 101409 TaxID=3058041 RepID=UPI0026721270|nr:MerR family transcriptional regulator [Saccharibacillus sp. CPCC 101409]MDO3408153.1 MerR family transcriptional regulator [Saccharibacillus sp. CPCC 101409]
MRYCIKEFASMLGLTVDTLRLYEKHEIVTPEKDDRNNYRYFGDLDARGLLMSRWYRSMGVPLNEAAGLLKEGTLADAAASIGEVRSKLEEEIRRSTLLLARMNEIGAELEGLGERLFRCTLKRTPGLYRLKQTERNRLLRGDELKNAAGDWMELLPFAFYSFRIEPEELPRKEKESFDHNWGLALEEEAYARAGLEESANLEYLPPAVCLSAIVASSDAGILSRETLGFMLEPLAAAGGQPEQGAFGRLLLTEKAGNGRRAYLEVNIPLQPPAVDKLIMQLL